MTTVTLSSEIGISSKAVEKHLANLKKDGLLKRIGPDKGGHWEVLQSSSCPTHTWKHKIDYPDKLSNFLNALDQLDAFGKKVGIENILSKRSDPRPPRVFAAKRI